jgi:hypothetical protein
MKAHSPRRIFLEFLQDLAASVWLAAASRLVALDGEEMRERITEPAIQRVVVRDMDEERRWN